MKRRQCTQMSLEVEHLRDERSNRNFEQAGEFYRVAIVYVAKSGQYGHTASASVAMTALHFLIDSLNGNSDARLNRDRACGTLGCLSCTPVLIYGRCFLAGRLGPLRPLCHWRCASQRRTKHRARGHASCYG
jgi:hypothetical protein